MRSAKRSGVDPKNSYMHYTYILKSIKQEGAIYVGSTSDLRVRLKQHNSIGNPGYSKRHAPWTIETYLSFDQKVDAERFETYLKSSSGKAFMKKRLLSAKFKQELEAYKNNRSET